MYLLDLQQMAEQKTSRSHGNCPQSGSMKGHPFRCTPETGELEIYQSTVRPSPTVKQKQPIGHPTDPGISHLDWFAEPWKELSLDIPIFQRLTLRAAPNCRCSHTVNAVSVASRRGQVTHSL